MMTRVPAWWGGWVLFTPVLWVVLSRALDHCCAKCSREALLNLRLLFLCCSVLFTTLSPQPSPLDMQLVFLDMQLRLFSSGGLHSSAWFFPCTRTWKLSEDRKRGRSRAHLIHLPQVPVITILRSLMSTVLKITVFRPFYGCF